MVISMLFHPNLLASICLTHEDRWLLFPPPGTPFHDPPPPSPSPPPLLVPHRPSRLHSQSSSELNIVPHPLIPGVYVSNHDEDGTTVVYREWSPFESKLAASILSGAKNIWIKPGSCVLVLFSRDDEQFGITISHLSDIVGPQGMVYVVEASNWKTLVAMADKRLNMLPIIHINNPLQYRMLINTVDVLFASLDSLEQAHMAQLNTKYFLKAGGHYMVYVQANFIESTNWVVNRGAYRGDSVFDCWCKRTQVQFKRMEQVILEPFDTDHAYVSGVFRTLEVADIDNIDPRCLVSSKFWTSQDSNRRLTLYEKQKNLPVFMLFESACGYALFRAHDVYKVERNYIAIEEYINRFDEFFEFIACYTFESTNEALMHLEAACNGSLTTKLKEFLVLHLPTPTMKGDEHCYSLALPDPFMADDLFTDYKIACSSSPFHEEIIRGVRKNIDKFFRNMKPGDLEKAQLDLARAYCRQKLISPEKGKSKKKRGAFQASVSIRKNPREK
ncbi:rRNA tRNA 2'-O-methyltransferase fibrillarin-like protein 1-like [Orobanche minor]